MTAAVRKGGRHRRCGPKSRQGRVCCAVGASPAGSAAPTGGDVCAQGRGTAPASGCSAPQRRRRVSPVRRVWGVKKNPRREARSIGGGVPASSSSSSKTPPPRRRCCSSWRQAWFEEGVYGFIFAIVEDIAPENGGGIQAGGGCRFCFISSAKSKSKGFHDVSVATMMRSVKVLYLRLDNLYLDVIINFMKCFPCMEELHIKTSLDYENMQLRNSTDRLECLDLHLKKLWISYYHGTRSHVEFAKYFVLNARVLESMVLHVELCNMGSVWWIANQQRQLQLEKRASIGAQVDFASYDNFVFP